MINQYRKSNLGKLFIVSFLLISSIASCSGVDNSPFLDDGWTYAVGSLDETPSQAMNKEYHSLKEMYNLHNLVEDGEGILWIMKEFSLPERLKGKRLALMLGRTNLADKTFLNGVFIGSGGRFPPDFFSDWNSYRNYTIPPTIINDEGMNVLLVKLYVNQEGNITDIKIIDEVKEVESIYRSRNFLVKTLNMMLSFLLFMVGFYHLFIYFKRKKDIENLYYSILCFICSIYNMNFFITQITPNPPLSYMLFQRVIFGSLVVALLMLVLFIQEFLKVKQNRFVRIIIYIIHIIPFLLTVLPPTYPLFFMLSKSSQFIFFIVLLYIAVLIIMTSIKGNKEARNLLIGFIPFLITAILDIILPTVFDIDNYIYLTAYGFTFFLISIAGVLANRFVNYRNEAEDLNINLEKKVKERTEQLEKANMELKTTNEQLQAARNIAERDMQIAVNVQSSFLVNNPPETNDWDAAFYFHPMAGISGDIYDFYHDGKKTEGAGIFDVSGHGIASGLITLLAKSIISRQFTEMKGAGLNELMKAANIKLTKEIGKSDIYLSGILLRFKKDIVEYVNAGHSDLIYKKGSTGNVHIVKLKNKQYKGMFLGLEGVDSEYPPIKFKVRKDDVLLMYTDCYNESTNKNGEEYDVSRIIESLKDAPNTDSKTILQKLVDDFFGFVGSKKLKDDLTILILKKK